MSLKLRALGAALLALAAGAAIGACGGNPPSAAGRAAGGEATVVIKSFKYSPSPLTVKAGTVVSIANRDSAQHTLTATRAEVFDSGTIAPRSSGEVKFTKPGTFAYICQFHPYMKGTVTVTA